MLQTRLGIVAVHTGAPHTGHSDSHSIQKEFIITCRSQNEHYKPVKDKRVQMSSSMNSSGTPTCLQQRG